MFYVQRDARGKLSRVEPQVFEGFTEALTADDQEIQKWFAGLRELRQSDLDMIRVLEDLIEVLTAKGVFSITDLPPGAQEKLLKRSTARKALGGLSNLIKDDDVVMI